MHDSKIISPACPKCKRKNTCERISGLPGQTAAGLLLEAESTRGNAKYYCMDCGHSWKKYRGKKPYEQIKVIQAFAGGYPGPYFQVKVHLEERIAETTTTEAAGDFTFVQPLKFLAEKEIEWFRAELYQCDFVNWAEEYFMFAMDGTNWKVNIEYETHCEIKTGSNHFPPKWVKFCKAVSKISGEAFY